MKLNNKVSIITGAGSGIGRVGSLLFANEGSTVVVADVNKFEGEKTVDLIRDNGGDAIYVQADITKIGDVRNLFSATLNHYGKLDILWSNAGITQPFIPIEETGEELYEQVMSVNVKGAWYCAREAVRILKRNGNGSIIFTASLSGLKARANFSVYQTSKGGVIMLTKSLAKELAPFNIRVNSVCPGVVDTPMLANLSDENVYDIKQVMSSNIPMKRLATPEEIAQGALFLAGEESSFITGVNLPVDGGSFA